MNLSANIPYKSPSPLNGISNIVNSIPQRNAVDYGLFGALQEKNQLAEQMAAEKQWEFNLSAAREAMNFNANQAELNRQFNLSAAREAMDFDANQAAIWRDWYENMANTSYQRAVADMKEAGLNPALAYMQGGAATSMGATAGGHAASGSAAQGYAASGEKANMDTTTKKDLLGMFVNAATQMYSSSVNALAEIMPF